MMQIKGGNNGIAIAVGDSLDFNRLVRVANEMLDLETRHAQACWLKVEKSWAGPWGNTSKVDT